MTSDGKQWETAKGWNKLYTNTTCSCSHHNAPHNNSEERKRGIFFQNKNRFSSFFLCTVKRKREMGMCPFQWRFFLCICCVVDMSVSVCNCFAFLSLSSHFFLWVVSLVEHILLLMLVWWYEARMNEKKKKVLHCIGIS